MGKKPGRPIKEDPNKIQQETMMPTNNTVEDKNPTVVKPEAVSLRDTAFGLTKLASGQEVLVRIRYNAVSGQTGVPEIQVLGTDRMDAEERFKIVVASELLR